MQLTKEQIKTQGVNAFRLGKPEEDCPYPIGSGGNRGLWMTGWWAAHVVSKVSSVNLDEMLDDQPSALSKKN